MGQKFNLEVWPYTEDYYLRSHMTLPVSQQYLWRAVLQGATERVEEFPWLHVGSAPEVNQFQVKLMVQDDVFILTSETTNIMVTRPVM